MAVYGVLTRYKPLCTELEIHGPNTDWIPGSSSDTGRYGPGERRTPLSLKSFSSPDTLHNYKYPILLRAFAL